MHFFTSDISFFCIERYFLIVVTEECNSSANNDGYIDELIEKISKSRVSHFIYPQFVKWLWNSLFVNFNSIMYQQFKKLREEGIRKNFSLCSYMIFRSLLLDKARVYNSILFTESENKEIQKELLQIKGILFF